VAEPTIKESACRHGRFRYLPHDLYVGRSLDLYGEFSEHEAMLFQSVLREDAVVVEAGANVGALTVPIGNKLRGRGRVIAYEPQDFVAGLLRDNVALNGLEATVEVRNRALGAAAGVTRIPSLDYATENNFGGVSTIDDAGVEVPVETIDALDLTRLDFVKIDVEGMEQSVLAGATATIARARPALYVENDRVEKSPALVAQLFGFGYRLWWHITPLFNPENHAGRADNVFGSILSKNLFCLPLERNTEINGGTPVLGVDDTWRAAFERMHGSR